MTTPKALGQRVKSLRKSRQLTLAQLSDISGVAVSTISKIENGALSPTLDKILRLAGGLELTIGQLIGEETLGSETAAPNSRFQPARLADAVQIDTPNYEYNYLCSELINKRLVPIRATIKAGSLQEFGPLEQHGGEEFLFVLEGDIEVHSEFYAPLSLSKGEGVYLDSSMGHAYVNKTDTQAEVICICTERQSLNHQSVPPKTAS
nr:XRE family transcriptional regulator [Amylibacter sp.]